MKPVLSRQGVTQILFYNFVCRGTHTAAGGSLSGVETPGHLCSASVWRLLCRVLGAQRLGLHQQHSLKSSFYSPILRQKKHFNSLHIPKALQKALPFKNKPKTQAKAGKVPKDRRRPAVIREPHERKILALLDALSTVHSQKMKKAKEQRHLHNKEHFRAKQKEEEEKLKRQKDLRKKLFRIQGQKERRNQKSSLKGAEGQLQ
ncbi:hypothetical protein H8959_017178 [Pygathrix nigripes]